MENIYVVCPNCETQRSVTFPDKPETGFWGKTIISEHVSCEGCKPGFYININSDGKKSVSIQRKYS